MDALLLFCCGSCLRGDDEALEYYELLGVDKRASQDAIRAAYRRRALELHPDKLKQKGITITNEHNEQFGLLKEAYEVLSDNRKRKIYDQVGATGLSLVEGKADMNPGKLLSNLRKNRRAMANISLVILAVFGLIVLVPVLVFLKINGSISGPWFAVWSPMLLWDGILLLNMCVLLVMKNEPPEDEPNPEAWEDPYPIEHRIWSFLRTVIFVFAQIFILLRMDGIVSWNWFVVFIPWMLWELTTFLAHLPLAIVKLEAAPVPPSEVEEGVGEEAYMEYMEEAMKHAMTSLERDESQSKLLSVLFRLCFLILLALKLNNDSVFSWVDVFVPFWLYFGVTFITSCVLFRQGAKEAPTIDTEDPLSMNPKLMVDAERANLKRARGCSGLCTMVVPLVTVALIVARLSTASYDVFIILIPFFITVGCLFCGVCCAFCLVVQFADEEAFDPNSAANPTAETDYGSGAYVPPGAIQTRADEEPLFTPAPAVAVSRPQVETQSHGAKETNVDLEID